MYERKFDDYESDVVFDVWMNGGNVDLVDSDRIRDFYDADYYAEETAELIYTEQRSQIVNRKNGDK